MVTRHGEGTVVMHMHPYRGGSLLSYSHYSTPFEMALGSKPNAIDSSCEPTPLNPCLTWSWSWQLWGGMDSGTFDNIPRLGAPIQQQLHVPPPVDSQVPPKLQRAMSTKPYTL